VIGVFPSLFFPLVAPTIDTTSILVAVLSGGIVTAVLNFFVAKRSNKTTYMETVADTLSEDYTRLKTELKEAREEIRELKDEIVTEQVTRRQLERELQAERLRTRDLELRITVLERNEQ
jgi:uncharacterized protein (DUF3084 family)